MMSDMPKIRTSEEKVRKMLKEEKIIVDLEMAIKKEQFRNIQKTKLEFHETPIERKGNQMISVTIHETNEKRNRILNFLLGKIGF